MLDLLARRSDMTTLFSALLAAGPEFVDTVNGGTSLLNECFRHALWHPALHGGMLCMVHWRLRGRGRSCVGVRAFWYAVRLLLARTLLRSPLPSSSSHAHSLARLPSRVPSPSDTNLVATVFAPNNTGKGVGAACIIRSQAGGGLA